ncbi:MAG TPA: nitroreductase family protein [Dehalococcoidia bacterium]|nr:nitroreductase family protein [Dehalococcoidia bacterium]
MDIATLKDFATQQRAIRLIDTSRDVDDSLIEQILEVGTHAPSGGNRQIYRFIVIRDPEIKRQLAEIYDTLGAQRYGNPESRTTWAQMPVMIAACSIPGSGPPGAATSASRSATAASVMPAVQNMLLAITALGLGSVLTTLWKEEEATINKLLGLPEGAEIHAILPIGWPDRKYGRNHRKPISEVSFRDRWDNAW